MNMVKEYFLQKHVKMVVLCMISALMWVITHFWQLLLWAHQDLFMLLNHCLRNIAFLEQHKQLNNMNSINIFQVAVSDKLGEASFDIGNLKFSGCANRRKRYRQIDSKDDQIG